MYFVKYGNKYLHDPRSDEYILLDLSLDGEENTYGYCDFTIYPNHPMYNELRERDALNPIEVYDNDNLLFAGYVYEIGKEFQLDKHVKCVGELSYLKESVVRPYSTEDINYGTKVPRVLNEYFEWLINQHNNQVGSEKKFMVGINQGSYIYVEDIYVESTEYPSTIDEIQEKILNTFGGYIRVRHENNLRYIDLIADWTDTNSQVLDFGINLMDYTQTDDAMDVASFIVPLGARMRDTYYEFDDGYFVTKDSSFDPLKTYYTKRDPEYVLWGSGLTNFQNGITFYEYNGSTFVATVDETPDIAKSYYVKSPAQYSECGDDMTSFESGVEYYEYNANNDQSEIPLTISGLFDQILDDGDYRKVGDAIFSEPSVRRYGQIGVMYSDNEVILRETLLNIGLSALKTMVSPKRTIEIKAVDLHLINPKIEMIKVGEYVRVRSDPHNLDSYFLCRSIDLDLNTPENSLYTLGDSFDTFTGQQKAIVKKLNAMAKNRLD